MSKEKSPKLNLMSEPLVSDEHLKTVRDMCVGVLSQPMVVSSAKLAIYAGLLRTLWTIDGRYHEEEVPGRVTLLPAATLATSESET